MTDRTLQRVGGVSIDGHGVNRSIDDGIGQPTPTVSRRRRWSAGLWCVGLLSAAMILWSAASAQAATATTSFDSPGDHLFTVPAGVSYVTIVAVGAFGGGCEATGKSGGRGAAVTAGAPVSPGEALFVGVGGPGGGCDHGGAGGVGGGGVGGGSRRGHGTGKQSEAGGGGGGASVVGVGSPSPSFQASLVVAAGGGGAGAGGGNPADFLTYPAEPGADAGSGGRQEYDGGAGTLSNGGPGGHGSMGAPSEPGLPGSFGLGGAGARQTCDSFESDGGGGGGGGYYGGGGGAACYNILPYIGGSSGFGGGGGGGSSFVSPAATTVLGPQPTGAAPAVSLTYAAPQVEQSVISMSFGQQPTGSASEAQILTVSNRGSAPLIVSGVLVGGADPDDFLVNDRCQQPVAPETSCQVGVRFAPQEPGARSATLTLLTNAAIAPEPVKLTAGRPSDGLRARRQGERRAALITCQPHTATARPSGGTGVSICTAKILAGEIELTRTTATVSVTVRRGRLTYATGAKTMVADGSSLLMLDEQRTVAPGTYTLILHRRRGRRWVSDREQVTVRMVKDAARGARS